MSERIFVAVFLQRRCLREMEVFRVRAYDSKEGMIRFKRDFLFSFLEEFVRYEERRNRLCLRSSVVEQLPCKQ